MSRPNISFLELCTINVDDLPRHREFEGQFIELVDKKLCEMILENDKELCVDANGNRPTDLMLTNFRDKFVTNLKENGRLETSHFQNCYCGRFLPSNYVSLIVHARIIKHTIMAYAKMMDLDMVKGHQSIAIAIFGDILCLDAMKEYVANFDSIVGELSAFYSVSGSEPLNKDNIKWLFNMMLYGGAPDTWRKKLMGPDNLDSGYEIKRIIRKDHHPFVLKFKKECVALSKLIVEKNPGLRDLVKKKAGADGEVEKPHEANNRLVSYFYQTVENHILYVAYLYLVKEGVVKRCECALEYDGLCFPPAKEIDIDAVVTGLNEHVLENTGMAITFKYKKYDESAIMMKLIEKRRTIVDDSERVRVKRERYDEDEEHEEEEEESEEEESEAEESEAEESDNEDPDTETEDQEEGHWSATKGTCTTRAAATEEDQEEEEEEDGQGECSRSYSKYLRYDIRTHIGAALFLIDGYETKFLWIKSKEDKKGELHSWTGKRWEVGNLEYIRFISTVGLDRIDDIWRRVTHELPEKDKTRILLETNLRFAKKDFQNRTFQLNIINSSEAFLTNETIKFDENKDLFGFNNGVFDLITYKFRVIRYDDYITMSCGHDYTPYCLPERKAEMWAVIKSIMPDEATRNLMLEIMSCGFSGRVLENFVLLNGCGRNGKGVLTEFLKYIYGEYGLIYGNVSLLTEKPRTGGNPELAALDKKRIVILKEPEEDEPLQNSTIKSITGGGNISARKLYSNNTDVSLDLVLMMECNTRPAFKSSAGNAENERVLDILFPNRFTSKLEDIDNVSVFRVDAKYKTDAWKEAHRDAFIHILLEANQKWQMRNYVLVIPQSVQMRTETYLNTSFPILELFNEVYTKTGNDADFVTLKSVYVTLSETSTFYDFPKKYKRKYNYAFFREFIETHNTFRPHYKYTHQRTTNVLVGYKKKEEEDMEEATQGEGTQGEADGGFYGYSG